MADEPSGSPKTRDFAEDAVLAAIVTRRRANKAPAISHAELKRRFKLR